MNVRYNIPDSQAALIAELEAKYADRKIRFDTGFVGSVPVQASGRIGSRYFYFRFRHDSASLKVGSPERKRDSGRDKTKRRKARRALRRGAVDGIMGFIARRDLRRGDDVLDTFPSHVLRYAVNNDVTGDEYNGSLAAKEALDLFVQLMGMLHDVPPNPARNSCIKQIVSGSWTAPMPKRRSMIRKPSAVA